uniref:Secreted protein n=1 Tax=Arundo donax TaxID=35708 RepID=A0A0A8XPG5_ARUDO
MRVVIIILLPQVFSGNAHFTVSHAYMDHMSSITMRYLLCRRYSLVSAIILVKSQVSTSSSNSQPWSNCFMQSLITFFKLGL